MLTKILCLIIYKQDPASLQIVIIWNTAWIIYVTWSGWLYKRNNVESFEFMKEFMQLIHGYLDGLILLHKRLRVNMYIKYFDKIFVNNRTNSSYFYDDVSNPNSSTGHCFSMWIFFLQGHWKKYSDILWSLKSFSWTSLV